CIHFHEVESAVVQIIDEFDGACTDVVDTFCSTYCGLSHFCAFLFRKYRAWCCFDEFLRTALHCTVTLAEMDDIAVIVPHDLNFYMPEVFDIFFYIKAFVAEGTFCFLLCHLVVLDELLFRTCTADALAAAAIACFDDDRIADV